MPQEIEKSAQWEKPCQACEQEALCSQDSLGVSVGLLTCSESVQVNRELESCPFPEVADHWGR